MIAAVSGQPSLDVDSALDRVRGPVERDEEAVARVVDLLAAVACEGRPELPVVPSEELGPCLVAHQPDQVRGGDDIGEHECPGHVGRRGRRRRRLPEQRVDPLQIERRAEALEHGASRPEVPAGRCRVAFPRDRLGVAQPSACALVRQVVLEPHAP